MEAPLLCKHLAFVYFLYLRSVQALWRRCSLNVDNFSFEKNDIFCFSVYLFACRYTVWCFYDIMKSQKIDLQSNITSLNEAKWSECQNTAEVGQRDVLLSQALSCYWLTATDCPAAFLSFADAYYVHRVAIDRIRYYFIAKRKLPPIYWQYHYIIWKM